jgi:hypothetical protein
MVDINIIELIGYATVMYVVYYLIARLHRWYQSIVQLKYQHDKLEMDFRCMRRRLYELECKNIISKKLKVKR